MVRNPKGPRHPGTPPRHKQVNLPGTHQAPTRLTYTYQAACQKWYAKIYPGVDGHAGVSGSTWVGLPLGLFPRYVVLDTLIGEFPVYPLSIAPADCSRVAPSHYAG